MVGVVSCASAKKLASGPSGGGQVPIGFEVALPDYVIFFLIFLTK
jgi:hypothetical protein